MKVASFFSGVGGIDLGFMQAGFDVVWANEMDPAPCETYRKNLSTPLVEDDIRNISDVPDVDIMAGGFPCQAFSIAGYRKGFDDDRGNLFFEMERLFLKKKPRVIFLENVKNLLSHDHGNTYRVIHEALENAGYLVKYKIMNACEYGNIPQSRERIYIVAFREKEDFDRFEFPDKIHLTTMLRGLIDFEAKVDDRYYYTPENFRPDRYEILEKAVEEYPDSIYQWRRIYARGFKRKLCPTLTASMGLGGHNVPIIETKYGLRKLTPQECFSLMGFPKDFSLPNQSHAKLYKQAGNSVVVPVIQRIAENIGEALI